MIGSWSYVHDIPMSSKTSIFSNFNKDYYSTHYWCLLVYLVGSPTKVSPLFESSFFYELSLELDFIGKKYFFT